MQLKFFAKREFGQFDKVYDFSAVILDNFIANWQGL
jgi:hypothetical protein